MTARSSAGHRSGHAQHYHELRAGAPVDLVVQRVARVVAQRAQMPLGVIGMQVAAEKSATHLIILKLSESLLP